jgi:xanthine dehydrogenase FAD-binding subunit
MTRVFLPTSLNQLWPRLETAEKCLLFAGGTDLFVRLRAGLAEPDAEILIGLERLEELRGVTESDRHIAIGAATCHREIVADRRINRQLPLLARAAGQVGSPQIRNRGTLGGNLMTASPAGDCLPALYLYGAELELRSRAGSRRMKIADFITGPGKTGIEKGEILSRILVPKTPYFDAHHFEKVGLRRALAIAVVSLAALWRLDEHGRVAEIRLAWGSVGPTVVRLPEIEKMLTGRPLDREALAPAAARASQLVNPIGDLRAGADYRKTVAGRLLLRLAQTEPAAS